MKSNFAGIRRLVLPYGASTGERIVLDGTSITIYNAANQIIGQLDAAGLRISDPDGSEIHIFDNNPGNGAEIDLLPASLVGHVIHAAQVYAESDPLFGFPYVVIISPQLDASDISTIQVQSGDASVGQGSFITMRATQQIYIESPKILASGPIFGKTPASPYDNPVAETSHALALLAGWANTGAGYVNAKYRSVAAPPNTVEVIGNISGGVAAAGTVVANLPAGYRPLTIQRKPVAIFGGAVNITTEVPCIDVQINGDLQLQACANATFIGFHFLVSLDA